MTPEAVRATEETLSPEYAWQSVYENTEKGKSRWRNNEAVLL
jgi:hypothetical protein